jgi:SAM-dependent methyltransferase
MTGPTAVVWRDEVDVMASQEFRYLRDLLRVQVSRVFGDFDELPQTAIGELFRSGPPKRILLVGSPRVIFAERSLRAMDEKLASAADVVVAYRLDETPIVTRSTIHTLREFEHAEAGFLEIGGGDLQSPRGWLPLSLWRGERLEEHLDLVSQGLGWRSLSETPDLRVRQCGLVHEFIDYYGQIREDVLPYVPADAEEVLEIGCGRGLTGELLQQRLGCRVTGVDLNPLVAKEAGRRLHRVVCGDIEELDLDGPFDAVVATELFEHLVDPVEFLKRVRSLLRPGGRAVISTPNVGHYSTVRDLLHGRWDYLPIGLLCYTHLRFFTRSTLTDLVEAAGFSSFEIDAQTTDLPADVTAWAEHLDADLESLATSGFWVIAEK